MLNAEHSQVKPASERGRELSASLSRRLNAVARSLDAKVESGTVMAPEDIATLTENMRGLVREARTLEASKGGAALNAAVEPTFRLLIQAETSIGMARTAVLGRITQPDADPDGRIAAKLREIAAQIEQAAGVLEGRGRTQS